jgi:hypothetical protein
VEGRGLEDKIFYPSCNKKSRVTSQYYYKEVTDIKYDTETAKMKQQEQRNDVDDDKAQVTHFTY